jgi:hypothetical protein
LTTETPEGLHPQQFRLFYIAYKKCAAAKTFLKDAVKRVEESDQQILQHIRERLQFHT